MKKFFWVTLFSAILSNSCFADNSEIYTFVKDYIQCLKQLKINNEKSEELLKKQYNNEYDSTIDELANYHMELKSINIATSYITPYVESKNELINQSSKYILLALDVQKKVTTESIKTIEEAYSPETMNNPENFHMGKLMGKLGDLSAEKESSWQMLMRTTALVTHTMVDQNPDENGYLSYLVLTSNQRKTLLKELDDFFDDSIKNGLQPNQKYVDACPAGLRQILAGEHKSAEERK